MEKIIGAIIGAICGGLIGFQDFGHLGFIPGIILGGIGGYYAPESANTLLSLFEEGK